MSEVNYFKVLLLYKNDVPDDVGRMLTLYNLIGC
jgi:hypothetical protein